MEPQSAAFWLDTIAAIGAAVWSLGAWFVLRTRTLLREPMVGELEIATGPDVVARRVTATIGEAPVGSPFMGSVIDSATDAEVRWHSDRGPHAHRGVLQITGEAGGSRITYGIACRGRMVLGGLLAVGIGAVVVVGLYLLLHTLALPSDNPALRGQVVQMVQCVHALWPPFLFAGLARVMRRRVTSELERTLRNAPYTAAALGRA